MNKCGLIEALAEKTDLTFKRSEAVINTIFNSMSDALHKGERIELRGFGSFFVKDYKPYLGRNPKTGSSIYVKSKKLPFFRAGKKLKQRVAL
ncbi:MAG: HU family DNA-binding protein [Geobacteraceae bacterium]|nr:HU family DNA-binding protein [Geobacteraceae bacterium]